MCESAFSTLEVTKTKKRSTHKDIESELGTRKFVNNSPTNRRPITSIALISLIN